MSTKLSRLLLITIILSCSAITVHAQPGLCPSNLDFELGDFTGWQCRTGVLASNGDTTWTLSGPIPNRHTIVSAGGFDPYGNFPEICPNGSNYSVKLGNTN